jgi:hypothetical protein
MTTDNVTSIDAGESLHAGNGMHKFKAPRGLLPAGVTLRGMSWLPWKGNHVVDLTYRGTKEALIAAGCLTPSMWEQYKDRMRRKKKHDENGEWFWVHRSPTKASPDRMKLCRHSTAALAMNLPGMRELFPDGIPVPPMPKISRPAADGTDLARDWKHGVTLAVGKMIGAVRDFDSDNGRFRFAYSDLNDLAAIR